VDYEFTINVDERVEITKDLQTVVCLRLFIRESPPVLCLVIRYSMTVM